MDIGSIIVYIKIEHIHIDIAKDVETRFDTSNYELKRPLSNGKNKKVIDLIKDKLSRKLTTAFATLKPKTYTYLIDDDDETKKARGT